MRNLRQKSETDKRKGNQLANKARPICISNTTPHNAVVLQKHSAITIKKTILDDPKEIYIENEYYRDSDDSDDDEPIYKSTNIDSESQKEKVKYKKVKNVDVIERVSDDDEPNILIL